MDTYQLAIDVGGTFTDFVIAHAEFGERTYKTSSTPASPADGVLNGLQAMASDLGTSLRTLLAETPVIKHGTTVTTNTLLTGTGARTGLIATEGFRDVLALRQAHRENQWDSKAAPPSTLVPRELVQAVQGRIDRTGRETLPLNEAEVRAAAAAFRAESVDAVAVSLLFSFLNPAHERRVAEILSEELPGAFISLSSTIAPQIRLYERTSTAVVNAYVGPVLTAYLTDLWNRLNGQGFSGGLQIMQSNGGLSSADQTAAQAVTTLLSGPAGGPIASSRLSLRLDVPKTMTIDMGGTSFEASLSRGGDTDIRTSGHVAGYALASPMLDISTIGAGGGSIGWIDGGGKLRVGPRSAGAVPGPACYGRGGTEATVTDANLLLGYLGTSSFGGGELELDVDAARAAMQRLADRLGIGVPEAAAGICTTVNAAMADSLRLMTVRRGVDAREFALAAAGGAGPLHAAALAEELDIPLVIVPTDASVFCAAGILVSDFKHHFVRTMFLDGLDPDAVEHNFAELEDSAAAQLRNDGVNDEDISFRRVAEVRYVGQVHTIDVALDKHRPFMAESPMKLKADFDPAHLRRFGHSLPDSPIEIVNIRVEGCGRVLADEPPQPSRAPAVGPKPQPDHEREAWFDGSFKRTPVYRADGLLPGATLTGPALIELSTSTVVLPPSQSLTIDRSGAMLLHPSQTELVAVLEKLRAGGTSV